MASSHKCDCFCWFQERFLAAVVSILHTISPIVVFSPGAQGLMFDLHVYPSHSWWKAIISYCDGFTNLSKCKFQFYKALTLYDWDPLETSSTNGRSSDRWTGTQQPTNSLDSPQCRSAKIPHLTGTIVICRVFCRMAGGNRKRFRAMLVEH